MEPKDLQKVKDAFDLLVEHVAKMCDGEYAAIIHYAADDVISILDGTWQHEFEAAEAMALECDTAADWRPF